MLLAEHPLSDAALSTAVRHPQNERLAHSYLRFEELSKDTLADLAASLLSHTCDRNTVTRLQPTAAVGMLGALAQKLTRLLTGFQSHHCRPAITQAHK